MTDVLSIEHPREGVKVLRMNRPYKLNALDLGLVAAMHREFDALVRAGTTASFAAPRCGLGKGDRVAASPPRRLGVQEVPHNLGQADPAGSESASGARQLRHPQDPGDQGLVWRIHASICTSLRSDRAGSISSGGGSPS